MKMNHVFRSACLLLLATGLAACGAHSQVETSWEAPNHDDTPFTDLAVIAVMQNPGSSQAFESRIVEVLDEEGIRSTPGFSILGGETELSRDDLASRVKESKADGVLIFKLTAVDSSATYVPPTSYRVSEPVHPDWWTDTYWGYYTPYPYSYWGYWYPAVQVAYNPGYWEQHATYRMNIALYSTDTDRLVWTANTATYDPASPAGSAASVGELILGKLKSRDLVAAG